MVTASQIREVLAGYPEPNFSELLRLCFSLGLVSDYRASLHGVHFIAVNEVFEGSIEQAELLMKGLLLGYFYANAPGDLSGAQWND